MNNSFYNGISGVKTHQFGLDVWAHNISNIDTIGFRGSTPEFSSLFSTALAGSYFDPTSNDKGLGAQSMTTGLNLTQGSLQNTDSPFDLAINGEGWFAVQGQGGQIYYTRAGEFSIDTEGNLVDAGGNYLMATSGNNVTATTLSEDKMNQFGQYYDPVTSTYTSGTPYVISPLGNVPLGAVGEQTKVTLPDYLYFAPEPTTYLNYQANLDPAIQTKSTTITSSTINNIVFTPDYPVASISGTLANNTNIDNLKEGDVVTLTLKDEKDIGIEVKATLDAGLNFTITDTNISKLDGTGNITLSSQIKVTQEIPNVEHFTTDIISPSGDKDIVDMTFTKRVPQTSTETTWDAQIQILRYFEDYKVEPWNPDINYDPTIYNVDTTKQQVTKIYDPALYKVDTGQGKVYEIIDFQTGVAVFGGGGQILSSTMPTLSNGGTPLQIGIGEPYAQQSVPVSSTVLNGNDFTVSGTVPLSTTEEGIQVGDNVAVTITDANGEVVLTSAKVQTDGTWIANYDNYPFDPTNVIVDAYVVLNTGFEGMISHVDLDRANVAQKDGHVEGFLTDYGMDRYGNVIAEFSNGRSSAIAKVAVYHFQNDQGLIQASSTYFVSSANSGEAIFYTDDNEETFLGSQIFSNKLEGSNVSYATALTELIIMQKAFDASAKSITTSDQLIQNAINMKK